MPPPGSDASGDVGVPSRSAIVGGTATAHHLLDIDCYSRTKEEFPNGRCIKSCPFSAGGRSWRIWYYPNGDLPESIEFISVYLYLDQSVAEPVKAQAKLSLLDQAGEPVPSHSHTTEIYNFCTASAGLGYREFMRRAWLEGSKHLKDDCFTIRCDVFVPKELRTVERRAASTLLAPVPPPDINRHLGENSSRPKMAPT